MTGRASKQRSAESRCSACSAPILTQLVGRVAALNVTADLTPLTATQQAEVREPNRLIWCLIHTALGAPQLRWTGPHHPPGCPHQHVTEHQCPPTTLF